MNDLNHASDQDEVWFRQKNSSLIQDQVLIISCPKHSVI